MMKSFIFALAMAFTIPQAPANDQTPQVSAKVEREVNCLAENIYYEARGEPEKGKLAVAQVTTDRVEAPGFPATVCGVVHQKYKGVCQFSWVCDRSRPRIRRDDQTWEESQRIAIDVLLFNARPRIMTKRPVLYYHANYVMPGWARSKRLVGRIGRHLFYTDPKLN